MGNKWDFVTNRKSTNEVIESPTLTNQQRRLLDTSEAIRNEPPDRMDFLHTVMCQVGLPRKATDAKTFERQSGVCSVLLQAGQLWNGRQWVEQPLPYGVTPRLVMVHISSEAIRTQNRQVEIGDSMRQFLLAIGLGDGGGPRGGYTTFRKQMEALAACRLSIGMTSEGRAVTVDAKPINRFEAWLHHDGDQQTLWPGYLELSTEFFETLQHHAVPLDYRALAALKHSALALDVYTWLAHRLCRVKSHNGTRLSWDNLRDQFGQEYVNQKDFKKEFRAVLRQVWLVYPTARIEEVMGGILLKPSPPPIAKKSISLSLTKTLPVDNS